MSAFEVCNTHIDVMVSAALQRRHGETLRWYVGDYDGSESYEESLERRRREVTSANAETWGATLLAENRASVNYRYQEDEIEAPYVLTEYAGQFNPVAVLSAVNCYEYQSCEHPGWKSSEARQFCEALRARMIHALPGYDSAPWEVTDAAQVTIGTPVKVRRNASV